MECWFDSQRYLTNKEKTDMGYDLPTRKDPDKMSEGRVTHRFEKGTDLYKWNYTIAPSPKAGKKAVQA